MPRGKGKNVVSVRGVTVEVQYDIGRQAGVTAPVTVAVAIV